MSYVLEGISIEIFEKELFIEMCVKITWIFLLQLDTALGLQFCIVEIYISSSS